MCRVISCLRQTDCILQWSSGQQQYKFALHQLWHLNKDFSFCLCIKILHFMHMHWVLPMMLEILSGLSSCYGLFFQNSSQECLLQTNTNTNLLFETKINFFLHRKSMTSFNDLNSAIKDGQDTPRSAFSLWEKLMRCTGSNWSGEPESEDVPWFWVARNHSALDLSMILGCWRTRIWSVLWSESEYVLLEWCSL